MSEEEINRKLEFIIEQQAQFVADIQSLSEVQAADSAFMRESYHTLNGSCHYDRQLGWKVSRSSGADRCKTR